MSNNDAGQFVAVCLITGLVLAVLLGLIEYCFELNFGGFSIFYGARQLDN